MLWSEVKKWAKENGYESFREKIPDTEKSYEYYWSKIDNIQSSGIATSVSKLATQIYNDITDNKWIDHQQTYQIEPTINSVSDYGS